MLSAVRNVYADHGVEGLVRVSAEYALLESAIRSRWTRSLYWLLAPRYYRWQYPTDFDGEPAPPDPFKVEPVSPGRIERFTRRCYPPWWGRGRLFGSVRDGDWDRRPHEAAPVHGGPPPRLFVGDTVDESPLFTAMERHFRDGVAWTDTRFVREAIALVEDGVEHVWHDCRSRGDVLDRCARLDEIYRSMKREGCRSYRRRTPPREREETFIGALEREIVVDVGRDGELLLVSGKHRLCLARLLGLEVPVAFLVRHAGWMRTRRAVLNRERPPENHPDLRDLRPVDRGAGETAA